MKKLVLKCHFFANPLLWASGDNLGLKHPSNSCKQDDFAAGVQKKPKRCRALKLAKGPLMFRSAGKLNTKVHKIFLQNGFLIVCEKSPIANNLEYFS